MLDLTKGQEDILAAEGHLLVTGGPGSGKTTISILKAAQIAQAHLRAGQKILFLSFARATVSRVLEAIDEERAIPPAVKKLIEVDTYHSYFWRLIKAHGYLLGLPKRLRVLTPSAEAIALSQIRSGYKAASKLSDTEKAAKSAAEWQERERLAFEEGRVCFDLFARFVARLLAQSEQLRGLVSTAYPFVILDEFQDTNLEQWKVVESIGQNSILIALADPEQRIFDWIGADPERLNHFRTAFTPSEFDLSADNHRSKGTEIAKFGNDVLTGTFGQDSYTGIVRLSFEPNPNQALTALKGQTLQARKRLVAAKKNDWSLAILVPTRRMTRLVSDAFRQVQPAVPAIPHAAAIDLEAAVLSAELVAFLMEPDVSGERFPELVDLVCGYYHGKGGDAPSQTSLNLAGSMRAALERVTKASEAGKSVPKNSRILPTREGYRKAKEQALTGNPEEDWTAIRRIIEAADCACLREIGSEARNVRLLDRGTQLRQALAEDWRSFGEYRNALAIVRQAFVQEHFATAHRPENGVVVMNMHKAKGKQFDEVIIFEGWPIIANGEIKRNLDRIVRWNDRTQNLSQARQNFRVSITRAKTRTTIMTPKGDPCVLLLSATTATGT